MLHIIWPFIISVAIMIIMIVMMIYCSLLEPHLPRFLVDSASFSKLNFTNSTLTVTRLISLRVINPNPKHSVSYDRFRAAVPQGGASNWPLDVTRIPPFHQERHGESIIRLQFELANEYVGEEVVRGITSDAGARGYVDLEVRVEVRAEFEGKRCCTSRPANLKVYCNPVRFGLSSHNGTGSMMVPSSECHLSW